MPKIQRILVPVDFTPISKEAAHFAVALGSQFNPTIDLLHVWELPPYLGPLPMVTPEAGPSMALPDYARHQVEQAMDGFFAELEADLENAQDDYHFVALNRRIETGAPAETIAEIAKADQYDLIVMGTHGRKGLSHMLIGSVAERVVRTASCPVVTVPPKGK